MTLESLGAFSDIGVSSALQGPTWNLTNSGTGSSLLAMSSGRGSLGKKNHLAACLPVSQITSC